MKAQLTTNENNELKLVIEFEDQGIMKNVSMPFVPDGPGRLKLECSEEFLNDIVDLINRVRNKS